MTTAVHLGPNSVLPCPSESCERWHAAHGYDHDCRINIPAVARIEGVRWAWQPRRPGGRAEVKAA